MAKHVQRTGGKPSPVNQSATRGGDVMSRLREQAAGLRPLQQGHFLDLSFTDPDSFGDAMNLVTDLKRRFQALPSRLRAECQNDPRQMLRLVQAARAGDDVSVAVLKRFGLSVTPPKASEPVVPLVDPNQTNLIPDPEANPNKGVKS